MQDVTFHTIKKNEEEEILVTGREYQQKLYFDLRIFYRTNGKQDLIPTKKGITLALELLPELQKGLQKIDARRIKAHP